MEELLASQSQKITTLSRGLKVEGEVVAITDKEITLDLGTKSEGILGKRDIPDSQLKDLKVGDKLKAYVYMSENEHGQVVLSLIEGFGRELSRTGNRGQSRARKSIDWARFIQAQNHQSKLQGKVAEVNKGGLIVEVMGVRGFLPNSQVGFELLSKSGEGMESLIGQDLTVTVIEVDSANNKLIFSERGQISDEIKKKLKGFKASQKLKGKIVAILPFGLVVDVGGVEGLVFISDVSWEKVEDLPSIYKIGQEIEVVVLGQDLELGRVNLSIKLLSQDPFIQLSEKFAPDEVVKGEVREVSSAGVSVRLEDGVEGFLPSSKMDPNAMYEVGKTLTLLIDSVDVNRRRVNLAPFVTSTAGLIYK